MNKDTKLGVLYGISFVILFSSFFIYLESTPTLGLSIEWVMFGLAFTVVISGSVVSLCYGGIQETRRQLNNCIASFWKIFWINFASFVGTITNLIAVGFLLQGKAISGLGATKFCWIDWGFLPVATLLILFLFVRPISKRELACCLICLLGISVVLLSNTKNRELWKNDTWSFSLVIITLISASATSVSNIIFEKTNISKLSFVTCRFFLTASIAGIYILVIGSKISLAKFTLIFVSSFFTVFLPLILSAGITKHLGAMSMSLFGVLIPWVVLFISLIRGTQKLNLSLILGSIIITLGIVYRVWSFNKTVLPIAVARPSQASA